jgi:hypothetical protein
VEPEKLQRSIEELGSDMFLVRERASERLLAAGAAAIPLLESAAGGNELEVATRSLDVLESLAVDSKDPAISGLACAAVMRLAAKEVGRAPQLLANIREVQKARATARLKELGAKFAEERTLLAPGVITEYTLQIGADWRGKDEDLKLLAQLDDLRAVALEGEQVTDLWLQHVAAASTVQSVKLKRVKVTAAGVEQLKALKELYAIDFLYFPIDDAALLPLVDMRQMTLVRLFDTKVSKEAATKLAAELPNARIDVRRGGFLGIGVDRHPLGCIITRVEPRSNAFRAGLEVGDVILAIGGDRPAGFEDLTAIIARHPPGDVVPVQLYRGDGRETLKITLGEWE